MNAFSEAHVSRDSDTEPDPIDEVLYSLAGGAAEVACGLSPELENNEFGRFPSSMGQDFDDLRAVFARE
jgi:hypothetical protein